VPGFEREIVIGRPPGEVFAYLADLRHLPEWQGSVEEVRPEGEGQLRQGSRFAETRKVAGRRAESTLEVETHHPDRELTLRVVAGPVRGSVRHLLEPSGDGTRLRIVGAFEGGGLRGLAGPLLERAARREAESDLRRLKQLLESGA
jgi:uncharacterized protein YndB with AHSA1/START domain